MDPLGLLQDDLKANRDRAAQSLEKLPLVAFGIGPERTRGELLPFLNEWLNEDDDEAMAVLAKQIGSLAKLVGGDDHVHVLVNLLEKLASIDEAVVRENAIESFKVLMPCMSAGHVQSHVLPVLQRMSEAGWMVRQSLCRLIPVVFPYAPEGDQEQILGWFSSLTQDETPMVRKTVSGEIGALAQHLSAEHIMQHIIGTVQTLAEDHMDFMRAFAPMSFDSLSAKFSAEENKGVLLPMVQTLVMDASWKVRDGLVQKFPQLCTNFGEEMTNAHLLPVFVRLMADKEKCVRLSVAQNMKAVANLVTDQKQLVEQFTPHLLGYARDESEKVRVAFSRAVVDLLEPFGNEPAEASLLPLITEMAEEECALVRSSLFSQLARITDIMGVNVLSEVLLPTFLPYTRDVKWRVRHEMIGKIALLAELLGPEAFETRGLRGVLVNGLQDHVFSIRDRACEMVRDITKHWGAEWALEHLLPEALRLYNTSTNYLHRMVPLRIISQCVPLMGDSASVERHLLPLVILACKDSVANVRFAAAKTVTDVIPYVDSNAFTSVVQPVLVHMGRDTDIDVQYYAEVALKQAEAQQTA